MKVFCFILLALFSSIVSAQNKRLYELKDLVRCEKIGTPDKPIIVKIGNEDTEKLLSVRYTLSSYKETPESPEEGMFEAKGKKVNGGRFYVGALTGSCYARVGFKKYVECKNGSTAEVSPVFEGEQKYHAVVYSDLENHKVAHTFKANECSFWPHTQRSETPVQKLFSVSKYRICISDEPSKILFKIHKTANPNNPYEIKYGLPGSRCIGGFLSAEDNYSFWMDSSNSYSGVIDDHYKKEQSFDLNNDGLLDRIYFVPGYDPYHFGSTWDFMLELGQ